MPRKAIFTFIILSLVMFATFGALPTALAQSQEEFGAITNPVPISDTLSVSENGNYTYTIRITQVMRGNQAWQKLKANNQFSDPPRSGTEYLLFYVSAKFLKGPIKSELSLLDSAFSTFSQDKWIHSPLDIAFAPEPVLKLQRMVLGGSQEGWVVQQIYADEKYPVIVIGGINAEPSITNGLYFAAYPRKSSGKVHSRKMGATGLIWVNGSPDLSNGEPDSLVSKAGPIPTDISEAEAPNLMQKCGFNLSDSDNEKWAKEFAAFVWFDNWISVGQLNHLVMPSCEPQVSFQVTWSAIKSFNSTRPLPYTLDKARSWVDYFNGWTQSSAVPTTTP